MITSKPASKEYLDNFDKIKWDSKDQPIHWLKEEKMGIRFL